jgi:hypothetical protein
MIRRKVFGSKYVNFGLLIIIIITSNIIMQLL